MKNLSLNEDSALVLQTIEESGTEDFDSLNESLRFGGSYLSHVLESLKHKGLIKVQGSWISLSSKGRKTTGLIWPETPYIRYS
jgi:predicted transcriptional regulator